MEQAPNNYTEILSKLIDKTEATTSKTNSRKVPNILFIENVGEWIDKYRADQIMEVLSQYNNKFKYMEAQVTRHSDSIKSKIPDLEKALEAISFLEKKQKSKLDIDYMVSNNLWAKSEITVGDSVYLWLGADIMCEYTLPEAKEVLHSNLEKAKTNIKVDEKDLDFIRDQITICEVNIARVYNETVKRNNAAKKKAEAIQK